MGQSVIQKSLSLQTNAGNNRIDEKSLCEREIAILKQKLADAQVRLSKAKFFQKRGIKKEIEVLKRMIQNATNHYNSL